MNVAYDEDNTGYYTKFTSGGDIFDEGLRLGMWANQNSTSKEVVAWRTLKTAGNNTGSDRQLQVGDVFSITLNATAAFGGMGFSLNDGGTQSGSYANRVSGSRLFVQEVGTTASWEVNSASGSGNYTSLDYNVSTTRRDYVFKVYITSETTANVLLTAGGTDKRAYNLTLNGSAGANIDTFSVWLKDDWNGSSASNLHVADISVEDLGFVEVGYWLTSGTTDPGRITDGLAANSTTTARANAVKVGGYSGTAVLFNQENTYTGATTVENNATARVSHASAFGTTAAGTTVDSGGTIELSGGIAIGAEALGLSGVGVSSAGAIRNTSGNNSWSGAVTLNADTRINSDAGTLTLSGTLGGGTRVLYVGGLGDTTISGAITATKTDGNGAIFKDGTGTLTLSSANTGLSGLVRVLGGTVSIGAANNIGSGTVEITDSGTLATTATLTRTAGLLVGNGTTITPVISVATGTTFTQNGALTGAATSTTRLGKAGAGDLIFNATSGSTFNGQVQIGDGRVIIGVTGAMGANNSTTDRGIDLGLSVANTSQANNVSVLASNNVTVSQSVYVAANTSSATRTIGLSGNGTNTFSNEFYMDGTLTVNAGTLTTDRVNISGAMIN
ncbi:MAG: hypothetical protein FJY48_12970, partial [Betaproteobacteria bacterium]|nr:hypothetical protein [Betaproteobacteria bacterium]